MELFSSIMFWALAQVSSGAPLTLDEAIALAEKNAFALKLSENRLARAKEVERSARGAFGPNVSVGGTLSRTDIRAGSSGGGQGGQGSFSGTSDTKQVTASIFQPIDISGTIGAGLNSTIFLRKSQEAALLVEKNDLKNRIRSGYYQVLQAEELVRVQEAALAATKERLEKANIRLRNGAIARFDVLRLETEVKRLEQEVLEAKTSVTLAKQVLNNTIGRPIETDFVAVAVQAFPPLEAQPSQVVEAAIAQRPELIQLSFLAKAAEEQANFAKRGLSPSLGVFANYARNIDPGLTQSEQTATIGLQLSYTVFDSGITKAQVRAAQRDAEQARIQLEQVQLAVSLEARTAYLQAKTAREAFDLAAKNVELATESLRLAQLRYDEGAGILLDVTVAQSDLTAARAGLVNATYRYLTAFAALQKAVGSDVVMALPVRDPRQPEQAKP